VLFAACAMGLVRQLFPNLGQIGLTIGMLHVGQECRPLASQMTAAAKQVARRPHLGGIDLSLREPAAPHQDGHLVGVDFSVLHFAPHDSPS
jgi:hypothetical protein